MDLQIISVIQALLGADNETRIQAEKFIDQIPLTHFDQGIDAFVISMSNENAQVWLCDNIGFNNGRSFAKEEILGRHYSIFKDFKLKVRVFGQQCQELDTARKVLNLFEKMLRNFG